MDYKTIRSHIDDLRTMIRQSSDDSSFSDEFLYKKLIDSYNDIMTKELGKNRYPNFRLWQRVCMPLCISTINPCPNCVPSTMFCEILRSKYPIPDTMSTSMIDFLKVYSLDMMTEYNSSTPTVAVYNKYKRTNSTKPYFMILDSYLYLFNFDINGKLHTNPTITLYGIFTDILALAQLPTCDVNGNEQTTCVDVYGLTLPIETRLFDVVYKVALQNLNIPLSIPQDITNDAKSTIQNTK